MTVPVTSLDLSPERRDALTAAYVEMLLKAAPLVGTDDLFDRIERALAHRQPEAGDSGISTAASSPPHGEDPGVTLTEFLLARIAEDEHRLQIEARHLSDLSGASFGKQLDLNKAAADCEVKRRIVNAGRSGWPDEGRYAIGWHDLHVQTLTWLALSYADHPDYREEWAL